jgi:hypothetical protein
MRRHSSLVVTSAIALIGGAGVFGNGAISWRVATRTGQPPSAWAHPRARSGLQPGRATAGPSSPILDDLAETTPLPYLFATRPRRGESFATERRPDPWLGSAAAATQWRALRVCESGDRYDENTGNGYYGAYQFAPSTWSALGYRGLPNAAPPTVQDRAALRLQRIAGWSAWPVCSQIVGL